MLASKLFSSIGNTDRLYVDDVFSAYTYTGNGPSQTINNGIDLAGKGGMVWSKKRTADYGNYMDGHRIQDTTRGAGDFIDSSATTASSASGGGSFLSNGLVMAGDGATTSNGSQFISWTFRKAPKFFDVVTYTGNGASSRLIAHSLGVAPGMLIVKRTDNSGAWYAFHRYDETKYSMLNSTEGFFAFGASRQFASDSFSVEGINAKGASYVAYLFAHDPSADGIIQCGSYESTGETNTIELGWEPQFMLWRPADQVEHWRILDTSRGWVNGGNDASLSANAFSPEASNPLGHPTAIGVSISNIYTSGTHIYLAIRRPNKPPTTGTQVYNHLTRTGSGAVGSTAAVGFAPDLAISQSISAGRAPTWVNRLRGVNKWLRSDTSSVEGTQTTPGLSSFDMLGVSYTVDNTEQPFAWNTSGEAKHQRFFRRAPGFFDVVCYTGTGGSMLPVTHSLGVVPEMIIVKHRNAGDSWAVYPSNPAYTLALNETVGHFAGIWNSTTPTSTVFHVGTDTQVNGISGTYVAYLFASLPGISKVGSYTGNGSSQTINCGFSTGARFILIKRTDSTGDWYVWDTTRGIIAANDPHLSLNTTSAEVTTNDSVDPNSTGFIVNQVAATNINVTSSTYLYLAIA